MGKTRLDAVKTMIEEEDARLKEIKEKTVKKKKKKKKK
jgi:hypothetical protein